MREQLRKQRIKHVTRFLVLIIFSFTFFGTHGQVLAQNMNEVPISKYYEIHFMKETPYYLKMGDKKELGRIAPQPTPVIATTRNGDWFSFKFGSKFVWVPLSSNTIFVRSIPEKVGADQAPSQKNMYLHHPVTVYQEANPTSKRLMEVYPQKIQVLAVNNGWYQIQTGLGPGWFYDGSGFVTENLGVKKIRLVKKVKLYQYPNLYSKQLGEWSAVPIETTAYASTGQWYQIDVNRTLCWVYAGNSDVEVVKTTFSEKNTEVNGYVGNVIFMTPAKKTSLSNLTDRMVTSVRGKNERLFKTFIVRPIDYLNDPLFFHPITDLEGNRAPLTEYLTKLFNKGEQIDLLEQAASKALSQLDNAEKFKVIIGIPHLVNKTGKTMTTEQLASILYWYIDEVIRGWNQMKPEAIELAGFYWVHETAPLEELPLIRSTSNYVHHKGYKLYWAPYYGAENAEKWDAIGFDFAWLQPNHYFDHERIDHPGEDMLGQSYSIARETGAGTMLEWNADFRPYKKGMDDIAKKYAQIIEEYIDRGMQMGANRTSILVYDSEGNIDATFYKMNDHFETIKDKFFNYLLQYDGVSKEPAKPRLVDTNHIRIIIDGKERVFNQRPFVSNGTTYVPMRGIFEQMGASVTWDDKTKSITAKKGDITVVIHTTDSSVTKNGIPVEMNQKIKVVNNITMVPLRFVSDAFGAEIEYIPSTKTIMIRN